MQSLGGVATHGVEKLEVVDGVDGEVDLVANAQKRILSSCKVEARILAMLVDLGVVELDPLLKILDAVLDVLPSSMLSGLRFLGSENLSCRREEGLEVLDLLGVREGRIVELVRALLRSSLRASLLVDPLLQSKRQRRGWARGE